MYSTTGLEKCEIADACVMICAQVNDDDRKWSPRLGLYLSVVIALTYLRRNRVQAELAETYGVSQSTISRAISAVTPLLGRVLKDFVPTADDLGPVPLEYSTEWLTCPVASRPAAVMAGLAGCCSGLSTC